MEKAATCVVVGLGYIGLPTAVTLARSGMRVTGIDINAALVARVNAGDCPVVEPGLQDMLTDVLSDGSFTASTTPVGGDVFVVAVPTPFEGGFKPDLSFVQAAARSIAPLLSKGNLVIIESTIPVAATEQVGRWLEAARPDLTFSRRDGDADRKADVLIAHCPERILPGNLLHELIANDRVIGGVCPEASRAAHRFYSRFVKGECIVTDARTAELCKLTENAFRDVNIAFANELSVICESSQVNVWELIRLANRHPRVDILKPGPGVGGHCIAVDPWFIVSQLGDDTRLIREARWINSNRPRHIVRKILTEIRSTPTISIACFGLSYKADVDDVRESPAIEVIELLAKELLLADARIEILAVEPHIGTLPASLASLENVTLAGLERGLDADLLVMLVDHRVFKEVNKELLDRKRIFDTRGIWREDRTARDSRTRPHEPV